MFECFFAFSNDQFKEGVKKLNLEGKKIFRGAGGLYGTKEGIKKLYADYDNISKQVAEQCNPQEAYEYEFDNHDCGYTGDDEEAIKIVVSYFGEERAKTVKRHNGCAYVNIDELNFQC